MRNTIEIPRVDEIRVCDNVARIYADVFNDDADLPDDDLPALNASDVKTTLSIELDDYACVVVATFNADDQKIVALAIIDKNEMRDVTSHVDA